MKRPSVGTSLVVVLTLMGSTGGVARGQQTPPTTGVPCKFTGGVLCPSLGTGTAPVEPQPGVAGPANGTPSGTPAGSSGSGSTAPPPRFVWERSYEQGGGPNRLEAVPQGFGCVSDSGERGVRYTDNQIDTTTGKVVDSVGGCETPSNPIPVGTGGTVQPGSTPAPPTAEEVRNMVTVPLPVFGVNPSQNGLTGLPTWLWDPTGGAPITATVNLRGYTASATATPTHYEWRMWESGDTPNVNPNPLVVADRPGTEARPAATYTYETHGDFTLTATVTWGGTYTYTGPGVAPTTADLGTTTRTSTRTYHVISVRAARIG